jgi:hypothetical protein
VLFGPCVETHVCARAAVYTPVPVLRVQGTPLVFSAALRLFRCSQQDVLRGVWCGFAMSVCRPFHAAGVTALSLLIVESQAVDCHVSLQDIGCTQRLKSVAWSIDTAVSNAVVTAFGCLSDYHRSYRGAAVTSV